MSMGMSMSMNLSMRQSLEQKMVVAMPPINWSLLDAFDDEGDKPLRFAKTELDVTELPLEERLKRVDDANEVFRFAYTRAEGYDKNGKRTVGYYKIPLMRDFNVEIDDIKVRIPKAEYQRAKVILNGAGRLQRIARAVPYSQLHDDVKEFVESKGCSLDNVVVVGVDRGGRLPSFIMRETLGKSEGYTLKVDQASGSNGELDKEKLESLIEKGVLKNKTALFVDSTVDSGRQIEVLRRYFDNPEWQAKIGHKAWGVVGSNENGQSLYNHRNINWGLDPDKSFEDDPRLMGVDYAPGSHTKVIDCSCEESEAIKAALLEVPRGVVLDLSNLDDLLRIKEAYSHIKKALNSKTWYNARNTKSKSISVSGLEAKSVQYGAVSQRKRLLIIGRGDLADLSEETAKYIADSLAPTFDVMAGTPQGNPGLVLRQFADVRQGSAQLYQPGYTKGRGGKKKRFDNPIIYHGETKNDFRENLVQNSDGVLVLGGNDGTLKETLLSLYAQKPVYVISGFGAVGSYISKAKAVKNNPNLNLVKNLPEAVNGLQELINQ